MSGSCVFCKIVRKEIPATIVLENEHVLAFRDVDPRSPTHVLVVPRSHVASLNDATDAAELGHLLLAAAEIAKAEGIAESGYRCVLNTGADGGQSVFHVHAHVMGGRALGWPPG